MSGYLIYEGQNHSNTGEIAVIATTGSKNRKTGDMVQVWILPRHTLPTEACKTGEDVLVCGDCPLRPALGGGCYVNVGHAPNAVWRAYQRGVYPHWEGDWDWKVPAPVRIGAYGDVAALPLQVVHDLMQWAFEEGHTCYTAQWRTRPDLKDISMASVQNIHEALAAKTQGWKVFHVRPVGYDGGDTGGEILCPATKPDSKIQCVSCLMCDAQHLNIYVEAHGPGKNRVHNREV